MSVKTPPSRDAMLSYNCHCVTYLKKVVQPVFQVCTLKSSLCRSPSRLQVKDQYKDPCREIMIMITIHHMTSPLQLNQRHNTILFWQSVWVINSKIMKSMTYVFWILLFITDFIPYLLVSLHRVEVIFAAIFSGSYLSAAEPQTDR